MFHPVDRRRFLRAAGAGAAALGLGSALAGCGSDKQSGTVTLTWWDYFTLDNFQPAADHPGRGLGRPSRTSPSSTTSP